MLRSLLTASACTFLLTATAQAFQLTNDSCSTPRAVVGTGTFPFDTTGATASAELGGGCDTGIIWLEDMWEVWSAPTTGLATLALCGTASFDSRLAVYEGGACPTQPPIACSEDACGLDPSATFPVFAGRTYLFRIGSNYAGGSGPGSYSLTIAPGLWDRILGDPILTPTGTAGTFDVSFPTQLAVAGDIPSGSDLGFTVQLLIDGIPVPGQTAYVPFIVVNPTTICVPDASPCGGGCTAMPLGSCMDHPWGGYGIAGQSLTIACTCVGPVQVLDPFFSSITLGSGSTLSGGIHVALSALPEYQTENDTSGSVGTTGTQFCFGDGSGTACPCGNSGGPGNGCANSINSNGAHVVATGSSSLSADALVLWGSGMPNSSALYFQGTFQVSGGAGAVFGDGLRCAGGSLVRLGTKLNVGGASSYPGGGDAAISVRGLVTVPGTRTYQTWYRNAAAFCTTSTFNLSNGISVSWAP